MMKIDSEKLDRIIEYLQTHDHVECDPYPVYDEEIDMALGMLKTDFNYGKNYEKIGRKPIEEMNIKEIATVLTFITRGERFCDGHIAGYVESGELLRLMLRLRDLEQE